MDRASLRAVSAAELVPRAREPVTVRKSSGNAESPGAARAPDPPGGAEAREAGARLAPSRMPAPDLADAVHRAKDGDEDAFRVIYRDLQPRFLRYLGAIVGDDAEDVASETWLHIARGLDGFEGDSDGFRGWAATIARHRATDHLRQRGRRPPTAAIPADELTHVPGADDTAGSALTAISTEAALALIARLPPDQAEAVLLRAVMGLDAKGAGQVLGKRAGAVRTAAYRGLHKLASFLEE